MAVTMMHGNLMVARMTMTPRRDDLETPSRHLEQKLEQKM
jgi:hypothetical protein